MTNCGTGDLTNPLDAIEQFSYLLFLKQLDDAEQQNERRAQRLGEPYTPAISSEPHWSTWTHYTTADTLQHVREKVFPWLKTLGGNGSSFERYMQNAEFKINKPNLLVEACAFINQMRIAEQNQDVQGNLYEYLLSYLNTAGRNGQFRTPRHIIRMMAQMIAHERIGDLAAGTCGFLVNAYQYIMNPPFKEAVDKGEMEPSEIVRQTVYFGQIMARSMPGGRTALQIWFEDEGKSINKAKHWWDLLVERMESDGWLTTQDGEENAGKAGTPERALARRIRQSE